MLGMFANNAIAPAATAIIDNIGIISLILSAILMLRLPNLLIAISAPATTLTTADIARAATRTRLPSNCASNAIIPPTATIRAANESIALQFALNPVTFLITCPITNIAALSSTIATAIPGIDIFESKLNAPATEIITAAIANKPPAFILGGTHLNTAQANPKDIPRYTRAFAISGQSYSAIHDKAADIAPISIANANIGPAFGAAFPIVFMDLPIIANMVKTSIHAKKALNGSNFVNVSIAPTHSVQA